ncbi:hypothetical protein LWI28_019525 [Acer negundo]|uniref:Uncharacterized protein n=1 Tax=Acer negundo TaxID=4023 RepID=A0AAD5J8P5_ACENE|nr:hypothetical protein LWI28_019525 [Acer negundo]
MESDDENEIGGWDRVVSQLRIFVNVLPSPRAVTVSIVVASNCGRLRRRYLLSLCLIARIYCLIEEVADNRCRGLLKLYPRVLEALKRTSLPFRRKLPAGTDEEADESAPASSEAENPPIPCLTISPYAITEQFMNRLINEHKIDYIIHGTVMILVYFRMGLMLMPWQSKLAVTSRLSALKLAPAQIL